jgi:pilus assembly protein CpaE
MVRCLTPIVESVKTVDHFPQRLELGRLIDSYQPHICFLDTDSATVCEYASRQLKELSPKTNRIGVQWHSSPESILEAMRCGLNDFIGGPFTEEKLGHLLDRLAAVAAKAARDDVKLNQLVAFLPAKAGAGASTLATHTALALSEEEGAKTVLIDFDLSSGITGFTLGLKAEFSLSDAFARHSELDGMLWKSLVVHHGNLDILPTQSSRICGRPGSEQVSSLLHSARGRYNRTVVDLPGTLDRASMEVMSQAESICMVVTTELPVLRLAREKLDYLRHHGLQSKVKLVLNRAGNLSVAEVEKIVNHRVAFEVPNNYQPIAEALLEGKPAAILSGPCRRLARMLTGVELNESVQKRGFAAALRAFAAKFERKAA